MIRLIVRFGSWLDRRFPEKLTVTREAYEALNAKVCALDTEISMLRADVNELKTGMEVMVSRMGHTEAKSAHVDAVKSIVLELKKTQDEFSSLKTSLGINRAAQTPPETSAFLNDLPVGVEYGE